MAIKGRRSTPEERLRVVQLLKEGNEAALVARMFGVSRAIVFRWQQKYDEGGPAALTGVRLRSGRVWPAGLRLAYAGRFLVLRSRIATAGPGGWGHVA